MPIRVQKVQFIRRICLFFHVLCAQVSVVVCQIWLLLKKKQPKEINKRTKKEDFEKKLMHDFHVGLFLLQFFCSMWHKDGSFYYTSFLISSIATHPGKQFFYFSYFNCQFSFCKFCQFNVYLFVCCLCCILFFVSFSVSAWFRLFEESTNQTQLV